MFFLRNHLNFRVRILLKGTVWLGSICKEDLTSLANNYILAFLPLSVHIFFPRLTKSKKTITIVFKSFKLFLNFFRKNYFDYRKTKVLGPFREGKNDRILNQYSLPLQYDKAKKVLTINFESQCYGENCFTLNNFYGQWLKFF